MNKISLSTQMRIKEILDVQLEKHEDGTCTYKPGLSDEIVAATVESVIGSTVNKNNVKHVRLELFGELRRESKAEQVSGALAIKLDELSLTVKSLEKSLEDRILKLEADAVLSDTALAGVEKRVFELEKQLKRNKWVS